MTLRILVLLPLLALPSVPNVEVDGKPYDKLEKHFSFEETKAGK